MKKKRIIHIEVSGNKTTATMYVTEDGVERAMHPDMSLGILTRVAHNLATAATQNARMARPRRSGGVA